jgi:mRNA interferase MazF
MIQGDVYWYKFKEPNKERPILILTRTDVIPLLNAVSIAEITTTLRNNDSQVWLDETDGMHEECSVNLTNIQTVSKTKIGALITHLSDEKMSEIRQAIEFIFNLKKL